MHVQASHLIVYNSVVKTISELKGKIVAAKKEAKKLKSDLDNSLATTVKDKYKLALSDKILSNNQKEILAEKKLNNEYQKTLDTLNKEYDLLGETGEEQAKRKLALEGYLGTYGKEILLLQQKIALKQEEIELNDLAYTNSHTDK